MGTRFCRLIWVLSVAWLGLLIVGAAGGKIEDGIVTIIIVGWPSLIGLFISYIGTGSFLYPKT
jgi:hypothetical protein